MKRPAIFFLKSKIIKIIAFVVFISFVSTSSCYAESKTVPFLKNRFSKYSNTYYMGRGMESGDLDNDGYEDIIVTNPSAISYTGVAFIFAGSETGIDTDNPLEIKGVSTSGYYATAATIDDLNGDGIDDLIIQSGYSTRRIYIYWGRENFFSIVDSYDDADLTISIPINNGAYGYGYTIPIADMNADGYKDLVVSDYVTRRGGSGNVGKVWIFLGSETKWDSDLDGSIDAEVMIEGSSQNTYLGPRVYIGDINNDGNEDLAVSAYRNDLGRVGGISIFYGGDSSIFATPGTYFNNTDNELLIRGTNSYDYFGTSGEFKIFDFDDDSLADFIVTDYKNGALRVFLGSDNFIDNSVLYDADASITINKTDADNYFSFAFEHEDINNDGSKDLLLTSPGLSIDPITTNPIEGGFYYIPNANFSSLTNGEYSISNLYELFIPGENYYSSQANSYGLYNGYYSDIADTDNNGLKEFIISAAYSPVGRFDIYEFGNAGLTITEEAGYADTASIAGTFYNPPSKWEEVRTANIFDVADVGNWDDYHTFYNPSVIYEDSTYKLWYSGNDGDNWRIGYATSSDGITWTRNPGNSCSGMTGDGCIFDKSLDTNWDDSGMIVSSVINDNGIYKMWYTANDGTSWRIGYATSLNGTSWSRNSGNRCSLTGDGCVMGLGAVDDWDDAHIGYSTVIKDDSEYKMWYSGNDGSGWIGIGYATSNDGITWTKYPGNLCSDLSGDGCIIGVGGSSAFDEVEIIAPTVIKDGSTYKMWYSGKNTNYEWNTGYATSTDGLAWTKSGSNPAISRSNTYSVDANGTNNPFVINNSGTYEMWYSGYDSKTYRGSYAYSSDGISWTKSTTIIENTYSVDVPTLNYKINNGSWSSCTANDEAFNEITEEFTCISSIPSSSGNFTYALQAIDSSNIYYKEVTGTGSGVIDLFLDQNDEIVDITPPDNSFGNTDFEITKIEGESVDDKGSKDEQGNKIGKAVSGKNKPKISFEQIEDDNSGMSHYEIRVTNTNDGLSTKDGQDYKWIGDIPHEGSDGIVRERDGVKIKYDGDKIEVKPIDDKYDLADGAYYFKIRAYDNAGNSTNSAEVKVYLGNDSKDKETIEQARNINLEYIGRIPYTPKYSAYYYTSNVVIFTGTGSDGSVTFEIDDKDASNVLTKDGRFSIESTLSYGIHKIDINGIVFNLIIDSTRGLFPEFLK